MTSVLTDLSRPALVRAVEENPYEYFVHLGRAPQVELHIDADMLWYITHVPQPSHNRVIAACFWPEEDVDARIEAACEPYRIRGVPMLWWTRAGHTAGDLGARLEAHGLVHTRDSRGMTLDLQAMREDFPVPAGATITRVADLAELRVFATVTAAGFGLAPEAGHAHYDQMATLGFDPDGPLHHYLVRFDGEPACVGTLFFGSTTAGLHAVTTLPAARGRGLATLLTVHTMQAARARGYRLATLLPSDAGFPLYQRVGFEEICTISVYQMNPPAAGAGKGHA